MKKLFLLVVCCLVLFTGCGKKEDEIDWKKDFQVSNFKWKESGGLIYAVGDIKNISSKTCKTVYIDLVYKNGSLEENNKFACAIYDPLNPNTTANVECMYIGSSEPNITDSSIEIKDIFCYE